MTRAAAIALVLLASPASAHCYSIWRFPHPQPGCFVHAQVARRAAWAVRREVMSIAIHQRITPRPLDTRAGQRVRPDPPDAPSKSAVDALRVKLVEKIKEESR